jgi:hypothetical protein
LDDFEDIGSGEKQVMNAWNAHVLGRRSVPILLLLWLLWLLLLLLVLLLLSLLWLDLANLALAAR